MNAWIKSKNLDRAENLHKVLKTLINSKIFDKLENLDNAKNFDKTQKLDKVKNLDKVQSLDKSSPLVPHSYPHRGRGLWFVQTSVGVPR